MEATSALTVLLPTWIAGLILGAAPIAEPPEAASSVLVLPVAGEPASTAVCPHPDQAQCLAWLATRLVLATDGGGVQ
ncbi:hypothetical protein [Nocardia sp. NPDC050710]|uniref:hypothetical protein n=1 Tax=Nocardia sp. NPDC050710 TaxID=3157220 RepID=UPI0033CC4FBE